MMLFVDGRIQDGLWVKLWSEADWECAKCTTTRIYEQVDEELDFVITKIFVVLIPE